LVRQALDTLEARGCRTEWVSATRAAATIPFGAVVGLLPADWSPRGEPLTVLRTVAAQLHASGARRRVAIGVDDAHLLDDGSAALVAHLAADGAAFVLLTVRSGAPMSDAVISLWKDGPARRLDLSGLPVEAVDRLLDHTLSGMLDGLSRRRLHRAAAGSPLALSEILQAAISTGALCQRYGVWRWEGEYRADTRVAELVAEWLRGVDPRVQPVLELVACGEPLSLSVLHRLVDGEAVRAAEDAGMVVAERSGARLEVCLTPPALW
jgi:PAS domain-containing protein